MVRSTILSEHTAFITTVSPEPTYCHCNPLAGQEAAKSFSAVDSAELSWKVYLNRNIGKLCVCMERNLDVNIRWILSSTSTSSYGPVLAGCHHPQADAVAVVSSSSLVDLSSGASRSSELSVGSEGASKLWTEGSASTSHHIDWVTASHYGNWC